ncbi:MAG: hypothetical protein H6872_05580 [Methylobacteriaceae bacterium]|nr:hypothetical protein [Methylobacteriaceae bacterium]
MHFDPDQQIGAITLRDLKKFLRCKRRTNPVTIQKFTRWAENALGLEQSAARKTFSDLQQAGFFAKPGDRDRIPGRLGKLGGRFTGSDFVPQIARADALAVVDRLQQLALQHNSRTKAFYVRAIKVFGSILTNKAILSDVDIALDLDFVALPGENERDVILRLERKNTACLTQPRPQDVLRTVTRRIFYKFEAVSSSISRHGWEALQSYERDGAKSALIFTDERPTHSPLARPRLHRLPTPRAESADPAIASTNTQSTAIDARA